MVFEVAPDATERRYKRVPFTKPELNRLLGQMDDWRDVINVRHAIAKAGDWGTAAPSKAAFIAAALEESNLLRRPIIQRGGRAIYSRSDEEIRAFLS